VPILIASFPYWGLSIFANEYFEHSILLISAALALGSVCLGFKTHKNKKIFIIFSFSLFLLSFGAISHDKDWNVNSSLILFIGGLSLACSHWINHKLCQSCKTCKVTNK
jgi:hypothetical protein